MANASIARTDDTAATLKQVATVSFDDGAGTVHAQQCAIVDPTTPTQKLAIDASGLAQCDIAAASVAVPVTDNAGSLTVDNAQLSVIGSGTEAAAMRVTIATDSTGVVSVDDNAGSLTVDGTVTVTDGLNVEGDIAHDAADSGNPLKLGAKAIAHGANPTAVAAADRTDLYANRAGVLFVTGPHMNPVTIEYTQADATGAVTDVALITVGAGTKIAVTQIQVLADQANTVETSVRVGFAAATLSAASTTPVAGIVASHPGIVPGSGISRGDGMGIIGIGADGEDLRATVSDPVGGNNVILISYFTIES